MELWIWYAVLPILAGILIGLIINGVKNARGNSLQKAFSELGDLRGKPLEEITTQVGPPNSFRGCTITDRNDEAGYFYSWIANNYQVTLLFDSEKKCIGVHSEDRL